MTVELPAGSTFGIEKESQFKAEGEDKSNRELARAFLEMFNVGDLGQHTSVVFANERLAKKAKSVWGDTRAKVLHNLVKVKVAGGSSGFGEAAAVKGFGGAAKGKGKGKKSKTEANTLPADTEVLVVVAPEPSHLGALQNLCEDFGMGTVILLVNARLHSQDWESPSQREFFETEFESAFCLDVDPHPDWEGGVMMCRYPDEWKLGLKAKLPGQVRTLLTGDSRFSLPEIATAFEEVEKNNDWMLEMPTRVTDS